MHKTNIVIAINQIKQQFNSSQITLKIDSKLCVSLTIEQLAKIDVKVK
jgi:hypothetical protein